MTALAMYNGRRSYSMSDAEWDFQKVHAEYRPRIQRYLTRLVGEFEAEDLTQEFFVRVSQALPTFRGEAQLLTWIYRIATNAAVDRMRQPSYQRTVSADVLENPDEEEIEVEDRNLWTGKLAPTLEQQVFFKQGFDCFCDFLEQLPDTYRLVTALNQLGDFTAREIADLLGLSLDVVKIRLHRGRARLLQELKAHCKAEDWL